MADARTRLLFNPSRILLVVRIGIGVAIGIGIRNRQEPDSAIEACFRPISIATATPIPTTIRMALR